mgnify:CR=1 FL=1
MAATSGNEFPVGLRYGSMFALTSNGIPSATNATVYEGLQFYGANAFNLAYPDPRKIDHPGDDRLMATDYLPPIESATATIQVSRYDMTLNAYLTGVKTFAEGEQTMMLWGTDAQGDEPTVGLFLYQQSLNAATKIRNWRYYVIPSCRCIPKPSPMSADQTMVEYNVTISPTTKTLWGVTLTDATNGSTEAGIIEGHSEYQPWIAAWRGTNSATEYPFSATKQAKSTAKISVWTYTDAGVVAEVTGTATLATDKITIAGPLPATTSVIALYELA